MLGWRSWATASASMRNRAKCSGRAVLAAADHLHRDEPVQSGLAGQVNHTHAPLAELFDELVAGDAGPLGLAARLAGLLTGSVVLTTQVDRAVGMRIVGFRGPGLGSRKGCRLLRIVGRFPRRLGFRRASRRPESSRPVLSRLVAIRLGEGRPGASGRPSHFRPTVPARSFRLGEGRPGAQVGRLISARRCRRARSDWLSRSRPGTQVGRLTSDRRYRRTRSSQWPRDQPFELELARFTGFDVCGDPVGLIRQELVVDQRLELSEILARRLTHFCLRKLHRRRISES